MRLQPGSSCLRNHLVLPSLEPQYKLNSLHLSLGTIVRSENLKQVVQDLPQQQYQGTLKNARA